MRAVLAALAVAFLFAATPAMAQCLALDDAGLARQEQKALEEGASWKAYGGEEAQVILADINAKGANYVADRVVVIARKHTAMIWLGNGGIWCLRVVGPRADIEGRIRQLLARSGA